MTKSATVLPLQHMLLRIVTSKVAGTVTTPTFRQFYDSHAGRGIWKWSNALDAYQRHLAPMAGQPLKLAEVGVQSGGSIEMWHSVLGQHCYVYGLDINPATMAFQDALTTITIGDQADANMWLSFFTSVAQGPIDILIDDGGHEAHQMLTTLTSVFDNLTPGGMVVIEDIHGANYVESFFVPAANYLGSKMGQVSSVHVYPFLLLAQRAGNDARAPLFFAGTSEVVSEFNQLWAALPKHIGGHVILENPGWGPFLTAPGLTNFFRLFGGIHHSVWSDIPAGCERTPAPICTVTVQNGPMQTIITGIHIYATRLVVEVASAPPVLQAVRKGSTWLPY